MMNNYPQIAVLGCDSRKANLYYDVDNKVWIEHLISSCVNNEQSILEFCQQVITNKKLINKKYILYSSRLIHRFILVILFD
jgi:hypothetical protein